MIALTGGRRGGIAKIGAKQDSDDFEMWGDEGFIHIKDNRGEKENYKVLTLARGQERLVALKMNYGQYAGSPWRLHQEVGIPYPEAKALLRFMAKLAEILVIQVRECGDGLSDEVLDDRARAMTKQVSMFSAEPQPSGKKIITDV